MHGRPAVVKFPPRTELDELPGISWSVGILLIYTPDQRALTFEGDFHHRDVRFLFVIGFDV